MAKENVNYSMWLNTIQKFQSNVISVCVCILCRRLNFRLSLISKPPSRTNILALKKKSLTSTLSLHVFHLHIPSGLKRPLLRLSSSPTFLWNLSLRVALNQLPYPKDPPTAYKRWSHATWPSWLMCWCLLMIYLVFLWFQWLWFNDIFYHIEGNY